MLNQIVMVGRLVKEVKVEKEEGRNVGYITLAISRSFKNKNGEYDTDFVDCIAYDNIAENTAEYCGRGDIIGVKGRIQSKIVEENDIKKSVLEIVAEKVTFLSSKPREEED